jgi:hypothetical protein
VACPESPAAEAATGDRQLMPSPWLNAAAQPPADLAAALESFAATPTAAACATPAGAYANCYAISIACARHLRQLGVACALLQVEGMRVAPSRAAGRWPWADHTRYQHWAVLAGGWVIDWSARQFDSDAAWPLVCPQDAYTVSWVGSQVWACELCVDVCGDERHASIIDLDAVHRSIALQSAGVGPYPDPRHDGTTPLERVCRCPPTVTEAESLVDREFAALLA